MSETPTGLFRAAPAEPLKFCWNCKDPYRPIFFRFLCLDCWRVAVIVLLLSGGGGESLHHIAEKFGVLKW